MMDAVGGRGVRPSLPKHLVHGRRRGRAGRCWGLPGKERRATVWYRGSSAPVPTPMPEVSLVTTSKQLLKQSEPKPTESWLNLTATSED